MLLILFHSIVAFSSSLLMTEYTPEMSKVVPVFLISVFLHSCLRLNIFILVNCWTQVNVCYYFLIIVVYCGIVTFFIVASEYPE